MASNKAVDIVQLCSLLFAAIALVVNAWFSWKSYEHNLLSRNISGTAGLLNQWRSPQMHKAEMFIISELRNKCPNLRFSDLDHEHASMTRELCHLCDEIGMRLVFGEVDDSVMLTSIGDQVVKIWEITSPLIHAERIDRAFPVYMMYFEALAKKARTTDILRIREKRTKAFISRRV